MPIVEIATFQPSKAYLADPTILDPALKFIRNVDGVLDLYYGVAEEDGSIVAFVVWESTEHYKAIMKHPEYPQVLGLGPSIAPPEEGGSGISVLHLEFIKPYTPSHSAPTTEVLSMTLRDGKTEEDLRKAVEAISAKIDSENEKYAPVTWGQTLEDEKRHYLTIGWESSVVHKQIMGDPSYLPFLTELRATVAPKLVHVSLKRPAV